MPAAKRAGCIITAAATSPNAINHLIAAVAGQLSSPAKMMMALLSLQEKSDSNLAVK